VADKKQKKKKKKNRVWGNLIPVEVKEEGGEKKISEKKKRGGKYGMGN